VETGAVGRLVGAEHDRAVASSTCAFPGWTRACWARRGALVRTPGVLAAAVLDCLRVLAFGMRHGVYAPMGDTYRHDPVPALLVYESIKISMFFGLFTAIRFGVQPQRSIARGEPARGTRRRPAAHGPAAAPVAADAAALPVQCPEHGFPLMHSDVDRADATQLRLAEVLRATSTWASATGPPWPTN